MTTAPKRRQGPRPLALHLSVVLATLLSCSAGLPYSRGGWLPWRPGLRGRVSEFAALAAGYDPEVLRQAVDREVRRRLDAILTGIERYRHHAYARDLADPPTVWREGASRLLDYGADGPADGMPVLLVPSLVNRHYILDLSRERSLVRALAGYRLRPLLIDWGTPGPLERRYTLTDYVAGRLDRALDAVLALTGRPPAVVGYCMGGLLATALAQRRPRDLAALVAMATPWDFHAEDAALARRAAAVLAPFGPMLEAWGELPVDAIQSLFAQLDPWLIARKFAQFGRMDQGSAAAAAFVALEDWLNDGVALPAAVARDCLAGWYGRNDPSQNNWLIAGMPVMPDRLRLPTLVMVPARDRIVPPASALALARAVPGAEVQRPPLGHIGMVVSAGAEAQVYRPLAGWLQGHAGHISHSTII
ncbi:MAG: alpha/beta fold hydrolase [Azospirillum sp.]|nr:alpha/beta fold hydrolase [Azospirillum sp.]